MLWPWQISDYCHKNKTKAILFIDDFVGTGHQFEDFISDFGLGQFLTSQYCVYAPLVAHESGIAHLQSLYPSLKLGSAEKLTRQVDFFDLESDAFKDGHNSLESVKCFYEKLIAKSQFPHGHARKGYGKLGIAYSFSHATPDNSIPLLWWRSNSWSPLFRR